MSGRILVIDDEPLILSLMLEILREAGHDAVGAGDAASALALIPDESISLVLSDIVMPGLDGIGLLVQAHALRPNLPVVMVTAEGTRGHLGDALSAGADGLILKPFSQHELLEAVDTALRRAHRSERDLRARMLAPTLAGALASAIEARDPQLHGHCERLAALAVLIACELGLSPREVENVRLGAILHDAGKIGIPDGILLKPGPLTEGELEIMRTHPLIGERLLEPLDLLEGVRPVIRHHHERWDGEGYPDGLAAEQIPLAARIVAVADALEAMAARRRYRAPLEPGKIVEQLGDGRGAQWDPEIVDAALALLESGAIRFEPGGLTFETMTVGTPPARPSTLAGSA